MGCSSSKQVNDAPPPSRRATAGGGRRSHTANPSRQSNRPPPSGRQSQHRRTAHSSRRTGLSIVEEDKVTDSDIEGDIKTLATFIEQHVQKYFQGNKRSQRLLANVLIKDMVENGMSEAIGREKITNSLNSPNPDWLGSLTNLLRMARRLHRKFRVYPSGWKFGDLGDTAVIFPSFERHGQVIIPPRLE